MTGRTIVLNTYQCHSAHVTKTARGLENPIQTISRPALHNHPVYTASTMATDAECQCQPALNGEDNKERSNGTMSEFSL